MRNALVALILAMALNAHARNYVVCVGVADYPGFINDLRVSANDARTIHKIYSTNGQSDVRCLTNADAKVASVKRAMEQTFAKATPNDAVTFFFSGHGIQGAFVCADGFLQYKDVVAVMMRSQAKTRMVIADACFAGKMRTNEKLPPDNGMSGKNVMFFLSSRTNETSSETKYANSLFTLYLERGLRGGADTDRDKTITAGELFEFVHNGVVKDSNNKQHPVMWGKFDRNMAVIRW